MIERGESVEVTVSQDGNAQNRVVVYRESGGSYRAVVYPAARENGPALIQAVLAGLAVTSATPVAMRVASTAQHRILTGRGWIAAEDVHEGDDLVGGGGEETWSLPDRDEEELIRGRRE